MEGAYVSIGGTQLNDAILRRVTIRQKLNEHWFCEIECVSTLDLPIPAEDALGTPLVVAHIGEDGSETANFDGTVTDVELYRQLDGSYACTLVAASASLLLDQTPRNRRFDNSLSSIASSFGADSSLADKPLPAEYIQYGETDWRFLLRLADDHGGWVRSGLGGIEVRNRFDAPVPVTFREHYGLLDLFVEGGLAPASVAATQYDGDLSRSAVFAGERGAPALEPAGQGMGGAVAGGSSALELVGFAGRSRTGTVAAMQGRAAGEAARAQGNAVWAGGHSRALGLQAGGSFQLANLDEADSVWRLTEVEHSWEGQQYRNRFRATAWPSWRAPEVAAASRVPGVQVGRIAANRDPGGRGRLTVALFWAGETLLPAPSAGLHCGSGFGLAAQPEVGDEVLVGFADGDAERPVVLGSVWNGVHGAPREQYETAGEPDANRVKRIATRSGIRVHLVDTPGRESVTLATPGGTRVVMTEQAGETGRPAIAVHSEGDIVLSAPNGRVHAQSPASSREVGPPKPTSLEFRRVYGDGTPIANLPYTVTLSDGSKLQGTTDGTGAGKHGGVPSGPASIVYGPNKNPAKSSVRADAHDDMAEFFRIAAGKGAS